MAHAQTAQNKRAKLIPIFIIACVAITGTVFFADYFSFEALAQNQEVLTTFRDNNFVLMAVVFMIIYALITAFALPGAAVASITGGFLFALFPGTLFNMLAATTGSLATFLAAKYGFGTTAEEKLNASDGVLGRIKRGIDRNQWETIFLLRLLPIFPFTLVNVALSVCGVPMWRYLIGTFVGIFPGALVYTWIGVGLAEVFARGEKPDLSLIFEPYILGPILGLCLLAILPIIFKALRGNNEGL
ncbi:MAG: TVP38/TMEM64 family protein [Planktomarina sp.]